MSESDSTKLLTFWRVLCIFLCVASLFASVAAEDSEARALLEWKASLYNQSHPTLSSWKNGTNPCQHYWEGISCDESMSVFNISLANLGLQGTLHKLSFASFPNLQFLDISNNQFHGNIPPQIGNLSSILELVMSINNLMGPIPREIGALSTLNWLDIQYCHLIGSIPEEIGNLRNLKYLVLEGNNLSGSIPKEIGMLSNLFELDLATNKLSSRIPSSIGNLSKLGQLYLYDNNLFGPIPTELGKLYSLSDIQLLYNNLSGPIPASIGNLVNLKLLRLGNNRLSGPIPASIGNLVSLNSLSLENNNLSGSIPSTIGNLTKLTALVLMNNSLIGYIPSEMNNLTSWVNLQLGYNNFIGHLPQQICLGGSLDRFSATANLFTGPIPASLKNCSSLSRLRLDQNQLFDNIADAFGVYPNLDYINVSSNYLYGHLSSKWGQCHNLTQLIMSNNNLSGGIPPELEKATKLGELNLSSNHLIGEIPNELGNLTSLKILSLSHNQLSGKVPSKIGSLNELEKLELAANNFNGPITEELAGLNKLWLLDLSQNKFQGSIPSEFGQLQSLSELDLSENFLNGTIEITGKLKNLVSLNLSHNNFSGNIPSSFGRNSTLSFVNISYNQLEGPLPNNSAFTFKAVMNNKGLCGNVIGLDPCNKPNNNAHGHKSKKIIFLILFLTLGTLMLVVVGVSCFFCQSARKTKHQDKEAQTQDLCFIWSSEREIMYENIIEATKEFDDRYLIGKGGQGSVYKAELPTGQVVAVKKLHSIPNGEISNLKAFTSEVQALTEIKHRNIVKLYGFCSNSQFSFLVYEFLEGGSLDNILENNQKAIELDWNRRVNIVKGVVNALLHMHHGCSCPIVHRDISSKNVLLNSENEACITDFGTAKFLKPNSNNMTSFVGTFGYAAPEIAYIMEANEKCDIYSFGVLTLEIIMGKHPGELISSLMEKTSAYDLPLKDVLDQRLPQPVEPIVEEVILIAKLAFACLNENPRFRPTMEQVSKELERPKSHLVDQFVTITIRQLMKD